MADQKHKKKCGRNFLHFWMSITPKSIKSKLSTLLILQDQTEDCHKIQKQGPLDIYFCLKMISKLAPQKTSRFWRPENQPKTWNLDWFFFHLPFYTWTQYKNCFGHLIETSSNCNKFWGQNFKKISLKG